ncbi:MULTISPECIES: hypothetical protein [unclassified Sphingomonas]|uniref:hypothetical protein n=1 Tax=unclassified Sphingomonas TaxID=196159 RepID=UPI001D11BC11|nr:MULTISPECIES: hypothetical protein [unclassified Sphingomonas]MCC2979060.1 hypothetical protein [Sphingomonas sp. IC4-52]MCD2315706.1 hypothetical protein [Sphingomonas sp. IC-11]
MQFLKILFWALIAFAAALFTFGNWKWVPISLFGNLVAEVNLPVLLLVTFLAGFLPTFLYQRAIRWRLRQRLAAAERTVADLRALELPPVQPASSPAQAAPPLQPVSASPEVA